MSNHILGISCFFHDSAAALLSDGLVVAAAQEERFTRKKHDASFPFHAIEFCLSQAGLKLDQLSAVVFYDKPLVKFNRLVETYLSYAPRGFRSFLAAMPVWMKEKLYIKHTLRQELGRVSGVPVSSLPPLLFSEHHQSHAASAFFPSPFEQAAVLCIDGVGEWATTTTWMGDGQSLTALWEIDFPHSLGLLYSAFTYYTGFKVNSGEYKVMGLAPYGDPKFAQTILNEIIDLKPDGTFRLNMKYFNYCVGLTMTNRHFDELFGAPPRQPESPLTQREMDLAASIQMVTEEVVLRLGRTLQSETGARNLCMAGGVALNCVANGKLLRAGVFDDVWVQPAAGDAGGALGAALVAWHDRSEASRTVRPKDGMQGAYLGPSFGSDEIRTVLQAEGAEFVELDEATLLDRVATLLADGKVVGWFRGRMEFGPRALGARSILGDPRSASMQSVMNLKIKYRESFRPFAPAVLDERVSDYFEHDRPSPYMLMVAPVREDLHVPLKSDEQALFGIERLKVPRSTLPAITHVDYSARIQTVQEDTNPCFYKLIKAFETKTGCGVLINTSFNVRGEPIVCTPQQAFMCFIRTEIDCLAIENFLLLKTEQTRVEHDRSWMDEFELD